MDTTVQIPLSAYRVLEDRDVWDFPEYRALQVAVRGTRAYITGDTATLSALGDYIDRLAGLVADRVVTGTGISARRWAEIAKRFPLVVTPTADIADTKGASATTVPAGDLGDCTECHDRPAIAEVLTVTATHVKHICKACLLYVYDGVYGGAYIRHTNGRVEIIKRRPRHRKAPGMGPDYRITNAVRADEITPGSFIRLRRTGNSSNATRWVRVGLILTDDRGRIIPIRWDGRPVDVDDAGNPIAWDPDTLFETAELLDRVQEQRLRALARKWAVRRYRQHLSQK